MPGPRFWLALTIHALLATRVVLAMRDVVLPLARYSFYCLHMQAVQDAFYCARPSTWQALAAGVVLAASILVIGLCVQFGRNYRAWLHAGTGQA